MHRNHMSAFVSALVLVGALMLTGCSSSDYAPTSDTGSGGTVAQNVAPSPASTPTPVLFPAPDASMVAATAIQTTLTTDGYTVALVDASGAPIADPTGWTFVSESPAAGTEVEAGSTITITLAAPPAPAPVVVAPAPVTGNGGATAKCNDGTLSYSAHRQGTCSHHGGVAIWY